MLTETACIAAEIWQECFAPIYLAVEQRAAEADEAVQNIIDNGVREYVKNL